MKCLFFFLLTLTCCQKSDPYDPDQYPNSLQKDKVINLVVRYVTKPPKGVGNEQRFNSNFDQYYLEKASHLKLERLYKSDSGYYFLITQPVASLTEKRNATGGTFNLDENGNVSYYDEIFRTWKMVPDTLKKRSYLLFDKMVKGESLTNYLPAITGDQYIEFPDDKTYFDVSRREWAVK